MLADRHLRNIVDYPKLYEGFPGVKIRGGITSPLWDREVRRAVRSADNLGWAVNGTSSCA